MPDVHTIPVAPHYEQTHRFHTSETFRARFFTFPDGRLVTDLAGNIKGLLGRYPRPGYTELDGERGAIVRYATRHWHGEAEVRFCSAEALAYFDEAEAARVLGQIAKDVPAFRWYALAALSSMLNSVTSCILMSSDDPTGRRR